APNLGGKFNDKTAIEADRTASRCEGNVYFAWSRFTGFGGNAMYFSRSTDHGATWSAPNKLSSGNGVQYADIAITGNGHVYVTYHQYPTNADPRHVVAYNRSTDCGRSFGPTQ